MKKILVILSIIFLSFTIEANFLENMQQIDLLLQQGKFEDALQKGQALYKSENISEEEKESLLNLLNQIDEKIKEKNLSLSDRILNNTGTFNFTTEEGLQSVSDGTVTFPGDVRNDAGKYNEYVEIEKKILSEGNQDNIYVLMNIYMREGLYERAMKLGLKSNDIRNIYLSALAARLIGRFDVSINQYQKVLSKNPKHLNSLLGIAIAYRGKKENALAIKYFETYLSNGGSNPNVSKTIKYLKNSN